MYEYKLVIGKRESEVEGNVNDAAKENWRVVPGSLGISGTKIMVLMERAVGSYNPPVKKELIYKVEEEVVEEETVEEGSGSIDNGNDGEGDVGDGEPLEE